MNPDLTAAMKKSQPLSNKEPTRSEPKESPVAEGGDPHQGGAPNGKSRPAKRAAASAVLDAAVDAYNEAADRHGFSRCEVLTPPRAKRLERRLDDIGGIEAFNLALTAIPKNDFLMGRIPGRDGGKPFRLDIDRLLQTDGRMGDVLAKLVDAASAGPTRPVHNEVAAAWAQVREEEKDEDDRLLDRRALVLPGRGGNQS
jgi:hypothetical protein